MKKAKWEKSNKCKVKTVKVKESEEFMSTIQEIGDLKSKFGKKYANNPMKEVIYEGCYETKMNVAKSEQTILADTHWRKCCNYW